MKTLNIQVHEETFISSYLEVLNGLLKLSNKELKVLEAFLQTSTTDPCTHEFKEAVVKKCAMKNVAVLNNYIKKFKDKGVLLVNGIGLYSYNPVLDPENFRNGLCFKFIKR
jgi:hypothetical protein